MSVDYSVFDEAMRDGFLEFIAAAGVASETRQDPMGGFIVSVSDSVADDLLERIEARYETLMHEQMAAAESKEGWVTNRVAAVSITLAGGRSCAIRLPGALAGRLYEHFTPEEVHALVAAIAEGVEHPVNGPLCRKP